MTRLYISGPVTGKPNDNRKAFEEARRELRHWYMVSIPHEYVDAETTHEEAMAILLHQLTDRTYSYRKGKCANLYDGVALLPGWEQSEGARLERAVPRRAASRARPLMSGWRRRDERAQARGRAHHARNRDRRGAHLVG